MDNQRPEAIRGKTLHAMTTEQLEELLRLEQDADREPNVALIEEILAVLDRRTNEPKADVDAAWAEFKESYISEEPLYPIPEDTHPQPKTPRKKHLYRISIAAAVLAAVILGISVTASATGFNLWSVIVQWSSETLGLQFGQSKESNEWNPELSELIKAVCQVDATTPLVPHYLPDGYTQAEIHIEGDAIIGRYDKSDNYIFIQYRRVSSEIGTIFQRDNDFSEIYTTRGIEHYISTNMGNYLVVWANQNWECSISGIPTKKELFRMIDSIYLEESL